MDLMRNLVGQTEIAKYEQGHIFQQSISRTFLRYFQDQYANRLQRFLRDEEKQDAYPLSDEDFIKLKGPPPWDVVNEMLEKTAIPYTINKPVANDAGFEGRLTSTTTGVDIGISELSSGEQTLFGLVAAMYQDVAGLAYPKMLLLDEPDAHLHPVMVTKMLTTLREVLLPKIEFGIILTTHSPTTCALAPTDAIFLMDFETRRPISVQFEDAVEALCVGLPFLSVRKELERQVFVESRVDAEILSRLWARIRAETEQNECSPVLNFVSSGHKFRSGSCEGAIELCQKLRDAGSTTSFAIVDFDGHREPTETVKVLGQGQAYSIENFILHPIVVLGLLRHRFGDDEQLPAVAKDIELPNLGALTGTQCQEASEQFCAQLGEYVSTSKSSSDLKKRYADIDLDDAELVELGLRGGQVIKLPRWYLHSKGHSLEAAILDLFPSLNQYGRDAGSTMLAAVKHVLSSQPLLVPSAIEETLEELLS